MEAADGWQLSPPSIHQVSESVSGSLAWVCVISSWLLLTRVAQRSQPKKLAAYMRKMVDYIVFTLPPDPTSQLNIVS